MYDELTEMRKAHSKINSILFTTVFTVAYVMARHEKANTDMLWYNKQTDEILFNTFTAHKNRFKFKQCYFVANEQMLL